LDSLPWRNWGATLERHPLFPQRTNVQIAHVIDEHNIAARIWERGAGETLASGSSACAVAAVARRLGRVGEEVAVHMPGGSLQIHFGAEGGLRQTGPVEELGELRLSSARLGAAPIAP
jgi:diaminopimelate epimerase